MKTNFDVYLEEQLKDPAFAGRFARAGEAWDVALQIAALREKAGLTQRDLARKLKTSQQQIRRLESPSYEGHSLTGDEVDVRGGYRGHGDVAVSLTAGLEQRQLFIGKNRQSQSGQTKNEDIHAHDFLI